jgi:ABC-type branched-subunit amino acid transport system ATPase component
VLIVEQYIDRALSLAGDVVILRGGEIVWRGPAGSAGPPTLAGYLGESAVGDLG